MLKQCLMTQLAINSQKVSVTNGEFELKELHPYPKNSKKHPESQVKALIAAIKQFGFTQPIIIDENKTILAGHGRYEAATRLGLEKAPTRQVRGLTEQEKKAYVIADNKISEQSEWDQNNLFDELAGLTDLSDFDSEIANLLDQNTFALYKIEQKPIAELKPHPKNYKNHPADQIEHLKKSITDNGIYRNVITAKDGTILAGHGVVKAATELGLTSVPVLHLQISSSSIQATKLLTADNEVSHLGEVDDRALSNILKEIMEKDDLLGTGYDDKMLANLLFVTRPASEIKSTDHAAEWVGMPEYEQDPNEPKRLIVSFDSYDDKKQFCELIDLPFLEKEKESTWFPFKERRDLKSISFEVEADDY